MFLEQVATEEKSFIDYLKGSVIFIFFHFIGQIPISLYLIFQNDFATQSDPYAVLSAAPSNLSLFLILFPFVFTFPFIYWVVVRMHKQSFTSLISARKTIDWNRILFSFLLWAGVSLLLVGTDYLLEPEAYQWNFKPIPFLILFFIAILMIPIQTTVEELIFRGYLLQGFGVLFKNRWLPLLLTSVIFGMLHLWNPEIDKLGIHLIWYYIGTGLFLGIITLLDDGMELSIGFHAANNLITALLVTASWTAFQTESLLIDFSEPSLGMELLITLLVIYPLLGFVFYFRYEWKNIWTQLTHEF
ncbi:MAG: CPBP family intramembrane metalloprotease [Flavobacteriaceae bacterium]|nr:CPBP family intramembrane metalloprotease [Flavobacteriaceae bacterium]